jgi:hypothetical protein
LLHAPSSAVVPVHAAVSLAWRPPHDKFHLSGQRQVELVIWTQAYTEHTMAGSAAQHSTAQQSTARQDTGRDKTEGVERKTDTKVSTKHSTALHIVQRLAQPWG